MWFSQHFVTAPLHPKPLLTARVTVLLSRFNAEKKF